MGRTGGLRKGGRRSWFAFEHCFGTRKRGACTKLSKGDREQSEIIYISHINERAFSAEIPVEREKNRAAIKREKKTLSGSNKGVPYRKEPLGRRVKGRRTRVWGIIHS